MTQREQLAANLLAARDHLDRALIEVNKGLTRLSGASAEEPDGMTCYVCGMKCRSVRKLAEHVYAIHDGPEPAHWADDDKLAAGEEEA